MKGSVLPLAIPGMKKPKKISIKKPKKMKIPKMPKIKRGPSPRGGLGDLLGNI